MGKFLSLRRSTHTASTQSAQDKPSGASESPATHTLSGRGSTRKRTLVAREAHAQLSDSCSDDGDGAKPVASSWLTRLHQMLTLGRDEVIQEGAFRAGPFLTSIQKDRHLTPRTDI